MLGARVTRFPATEAAHGDSLPISHDTLEYAQRSLGQLAAESGKTDDLAYYTIGKLSHSESATAANSARRPGLGGEEVRNSTTSENRRNAHDGCGDGVQHRT